MFLNIEQHITKALQDDIDHQNYRQYNITTLQNLKPVIFGYYGQNNVELAINLLNLFYDYILSINNIFTSPFQTVTIKKLRKYIDDLIIINSQIANKNTDYKKDIMILNKKRNSKL